MSNTMPDTTPPLAQTELIAAAEGYADVYDGTGAIPSCDVRACIQNAFFAGAEWNRRASAQAGDVALLRQAIEVEKMLCAALGRPWSTTGISVESLCKEVSVLRARLGETK